MIIRAAEVGDIESMYAISCSVHLSALYETLIPSSSYEKFRRFYTVDSVKRARYYEKISNRLDDPAWHVWVADCAGGVRGFTMTYETEDNLTLRGLFVDNEWQGKGIGKELFKKSLYGQSGTKPIFLEVIENNERARTMYENAGFTATDASPDAFYGAPMIRMRKY